MNKIVHFISNYLSNTQSWLYTQLKNCQGHEQIIYTQQVRNLDMFFWENIRVMGFKKGILAALSNPSVLYNKLYNRVFGYYPIYKKWMKIDKPDLIHAHFGMISYGVLPIKKKIKIPLVTTFYGYDLSSLPNIYPIWRKRYGFLFSTGELFLVEGNNMKRVLVKLGCPEEKVVVQRLGVDLQKIKFSVRRVDESGKIRILITNTFTEKKGTPYAIEAFAKSYQKFKNIDLTVIGDSTGHPKHEKEKEKIMYLINKYNLQDCVDLMGYQPHSVFIEQVYSHHIFMAPSVHAADGDMEGGSPVTVIEASASGMPVLSTKHCDIPEVIIDGESGYLVPERDIESLSERLNYLISHPELWKSMGEKGRRHIEENYNAVLQGQRLGEIYSRVIQAAGL